MLAAVKVGYLLRDPWARSFPPRTAPSSALFGGFGLLLLAALDCFGDLFDASQSGIPGRSDGCELGDRACELCVVHLVAHLPSDWRDVDQADAIQHREMLGDGLTGYRQLLAEAGRSSDAVRQEQVEHPPPGWIPDRRPEVIVNGGGHPVVINCMR